MKSLKHFSRQYRIWRNKQKQFFSLKKLTPLMLAILLSKEAHGQDKRLNDFIPNTDLFSIYGFFENYIPTFVDLDTDGDMDIIFKRYSDVYNVYKSFYLKNNGINGSLNFTEDDFIKDSSNLYPILEIDPITGDLPLEKICFFFDYDHDGDMDILKKDYYNSENSDSLKFYKNISSINKNPIFDTIPSLILENKDFTKVVDINGDGLEDLVSFDIYNNQLNYYPNIGTLNLPSFGNQISKTLEFNLFEKPGTIEDFNGDGLMDIGIVFQDDFNSQFLPTMVTYHKCLNQNPLIFDSIETQFIYEKQFLFNLENFDKTSVKLIDFDNDGDLDLYLSGFYEGPYGSSILSEMLFLENKNLKTMNVVSGNLIMDWNKNLELDGEELEIEIEFPGETTQELSINPQNYFAGKNMNFETVDTILKYPIPKTIKVWNDYRYYYLTYNNPVFFSGNITSGNVKIYPDSLEGFNIIPPFYEYNFEADTNFFIDSLKFYFQLINDEKNLTIDLTGFANRPGFEVYQNLTYQNKSALLDSGIIEFTPDSLYTFIESNPAPTSNSSGTYFWTIDSIDKFESRSIDIKLLLSADAEIGKKTKSTALFNSNFGTDRVPQNNYDTLIQSITGSFDPNDKIVTPVPNERGIIEITDQPFEYTVRFQNTGNDTAFTVIITDTLEKDFDINTFKLLAASDPFVFDMKSGNVATWRFNQILLPPKETNEQGSNGFVKYSIKPLEGKGIGTEFTNTANIYFDFNKPIITNETRNIFGVINGIQLHDNQPEIKIKAYPNPVHDKLLIEINNPKNEDMIFRVYDINGTELFSKTIDSNFFHFSTQDYAPAMYLYTIESASGFGKGKFVKE